MCVVLDIRVYCVLPVLVLGSRVLTGVCLWCCQVRLRCFPRLLQLRGRLDLLAGQMAARQSRTAGVTAPTAEMEPLLSYRDGEALPSPGVGKAAARLVVGARHAGKAEALLCGAGGPQKFVKLQLYSVVLTVLQCS